METELHGTTQQHSTPQNGAAWLENILKYGGWYYAFFVLLGFVELQAYYTAFGIEIWTYLSVGEILLSFLSTVGTLVLLTASFLFQMYAQKDISPYKFINKKHHSKIYNALMMLMYVGVPISFLMQANYLYQGTNALIPYDTMKWFVWFFAGGLIGITLGGFDSGEDLKDYGGYALVTLAFIVLWLCTTKRQTGEQLKLSGSHSEVVLFTPSDTIATSDNLVYVGRCNAVTFIYDRSIDYTRVIDNLNVHEAMIHPVIKRKK